MRATKRLKSAAAPTLFFLGVGWLAVMAFVAAWPDMEASGFDLATTLVADRGLQSLRCPRLITRDEETTVRASFSNPTDEPSSFRVRTRISSGFLTLMRQDSQQVTLKPGESQELSWPVVADDAVFDRVVMVRVLAMRGAGRPARESSCGILVARVSGVSGQWLFRAGLVLGLVLLGAGAGWWWYRRRPLGESERTTARRGAALAIVVIASLVTGMLNIWLLSHLLLIASILLVLLILEQVWTP